MDARQRLAFDDAVRQTIQHERDTLANLQHELEGLRADVDQLAAQIGWQVTDHQEKEILRLHRLGLSNNMIALVTGRALNTVRERTDRLPSPARSLGRDGRSRAHPRAS